MSIDIETSIASLRKQLDEIASAVSGGSPAGDERIRAVMEAHRIHSPEELEQRLSKLDWIEACRARAEQIEKDERPVAMQALKLKVLKTLAKMDGSASRESILRSCHLSAKVMNEVEAALVEDGMIRSTKTTTTGRATKVYELARVVFA